MLGGGVWARTERIGKLVFPVGGGDSLGELVDRNTPDLVTFSTTTDASGNLVIDDVLTALSTMIHLNHGPFGSGHRLLGIDASGVPNLSGKF